MNGWSRMVVIGATSLAGLAAAMPSSAAERRFSVTSFERIRVDGPFDVRVQTGLGAGARASGDTRAVDGVSVRVEGRTLIVARDAAAWGGWPGESVGQAVVTLSTPALDTAWLNGPGTLSIDRMKGARVQIAISGAGAVAVERIEAERLELGVSGAGEARVASGSALILKALARGTGGIAADGLVARDLEVVADGVGAVRLRAERTAKVSARGSVDVAVTGDPACTVQATGSATVRCGEGEQ